MITPNNIQPPPSSSKNINLAGKNKHNVVPTGNATAAGTTARPGTVDVISTGTDGGKIYLGWVDKTKLAFFSRAGDRVLNPEKYSKYGAKGAKKDNANRPAQAKRVPPVNELLLRPNVDKLAGEIVIKYISDNSIAQPKAFALDSTLFGNDDISFEMKLKVHHAMSAFDLKREHSGQAIRNEIFDHIGTRDNPSIPNAADFKNCMETVNFDGGVVTKMMSQMMWRSVNRNIDPEALDEIKEYCRENGHYDTMVAFGEGVIEKVLKIREEKGNKGVRVEHGW